MSRAMTFYDYLVMERKQLHTQLKKLDAMQLDYADLSTDELPACYTYSDWHAYYVNWSK